MYIRTNNNFKKILGKNYFNKIKSVDNLLSKQVTDAKIKNVDGCYCFDFLTSDGQGPFSPTLVDKTGNECFYNRFYIEDFIPKKLNKISYLLQGCRFGMELAKKLSKLFPFKFKVIVSCAKSGKDTTVTFHKIRKGTVYLKRNLNSYKINGLMVIYT